MRISINGKRQRLCVLLCSLLLLEYLNFGIFSSTQVSASRMGRFDMASPIGTSQHSSMSDNVYTGLDLLAAFKNFTRFTMASAGKSRGPGYRNNFTAGAVLSGALVAGLNIYFRLASLIYNQFDSIQITTFLHRKDGMK